MEGQWGWRRVDVACLRSKEMSEKKSIRSGKPTIGEMKWYVPGSAVCPFEVCGHTFEVRLFSMVT